MANESVQALIDSKRYNAALQSIDLNNPVGAGVTVDQASTLVRSLVKRGQLKRALHLSSSWLAQRKQDAEIWFLHGNAALRLGDIDTALESLHEADRLNPDQPLTLANLAVGYNSTDHHGKAMELLDRALEINPRYAFAYQKQGSILCRAGRVREGVRAFERAAMLTPKPESMFARLLYWKNYLPDTDPTLLVGDAAAWGGRFTHEFEKGVGVHLNDLDHHRPLKIGFVSPDFCAHPVSFFVEPLFRGLDRSKYRVFAYSDVVRPDKVTDSISQMVDVYHHTVGKDIQSLARLILNDQIDILVDLAGHTGSGRLDLFHMRPAPVQMSWLGYPATTGSQGIDFRLTDRYADPVGGSENHNTETLLRVDGGFLCYVPSERTPEPSTVSPYEENGYITFGSFNNLAKLSPQCLDLWADIMNQVPDSRLMIKRRELKDPWVRNHFIDHFASRGINKERLEFKTSQTTIEGHLRNYARIDVALDSFPYNGTTTTFESLWMNVPVISLGGVTHASRVGQSILRFGGLEELAADNPADYLVKAVGLAHDPNRLSGYRRSLRQTLGASALMDQGRFTASIDRILRQCWIDWTERKRNEEKVILEDDET